MSNAFDSRALQYTDAYGQRFMREGTFRYKVTAAMAPCTNDEWPFLIEVTEGRDDGMKQHTVTLKYEDRVFRPEDGNPALQVRSGDLVLWVCRQPDAPPFQVAGDKEFFNSGRLVNESGYAHAFGAAGDYEWVDAYGSGLGGIVRVSDPAIRDHRDINKWCRDMATGALLMISGTGAEPAEIEILTGQTVYFAVTEAPGVSVTDRRLVDVLAETAPRAP